MILPKLSWELLVRNSNKKVDAIQLKKTVFLRSKNTAYNFFRWSKVFLVALSSQQQDNFRFSMTKQSNVIINEY